MYGDSSDFDDCMSASSAEWENRKRTVMRCSRRFEGDDKRIVQCARDAAKSGSDSNDSDFKNDKREVCGKYF